MFNAFIVEGRLATPDAHGELGLPLWVAVLAVVCATPLLFGPAVASSPVLMVASIGVMTGLLMSRSLGVVTGEWKREGFAALALIVASVVALWLAEQDNPHSVRGLAVMVCRRFAGRRAP